jgi:hypothetical protein
VQLPSGTVAAAEALASGQPPGPIGPDHEFVVLVGEGSPRPERSVRVEVLPEAIAELLRSLPGDRARLAAFAARHEATLDEVLSLVDDLERDGVLVRT